MTSTSLARRKDAAQTLLARNKTSPSYPRQDVPSALVNGLHREDASMGDHRKLKSLKVLSEFKSTSLSVSKALELLMGAQTEPLPNLYSTTTGPSPKLGLKSMSQFLKCCCSTSTATSTSLGNSVGPFVMVSRLAVQFSSGCVRSMSLHAGSKFNWTLISSLMFRSHTAC